MKKKNIAYIEVEVMDKATKKCTRGLLGGFTYDILGYIRIYPSPNTNLYCASSMYSVVQITTKYTTGHMESVYFENSTEEQNEAMDKLSVLSTNFKCASGIKGADIPLDAYKEKPSSFNTYLNNKTSTTNSGKNQSSFDKNYTTSSSGNYTGTYKAPKPVITRFSRKTKKPTKKSLKAMRLATRKITEDLNNTGTINTTVNNGVANNGIQDAWQGAHMPASDYDYMY